MAVDLVADVMEHVPPLGATAGFASLYPPYGLATGTLGGFQKILYRVRCDHISVVQYAQRFSDLFSQYVLSRR